MASFKFDGRIYVIEAAASRAGPHLSTSKLATEVVSTHVTDVAAGPDRQSDKLNLLLHLCHSQVFVSHHAPDRCKELQCSGRHTGARRVLVDSVGC